MRHNRTCNVWLWLCGCVCFQVVISSINSTYIPNKLCVLLEDAKELAAWTALWNLGTVRIQKHSFHLSVVSVYESEVYLVTIPINLLCVRNQLFLHVMCTLSLFAVLVHHSVNHHLM